MSASWNSPQGGSRVAKKAESAESDFCERSPTNRVRLEPSTDAAITSRICRVGIVQSLLVDGSVRLISVRLISENMDLNDWHAVGTRAGGEMIGEF